MGIDYTVRRRIHNAFVFGIEVLWLLFLSIPAWVIATAWHCCWRVPTGHFNDRDDAKQSGIGPLATLLGLAITQAVALLYVQYQQGRSPFALVVFFLIALVVIGGMSGIMRAASADRKAVFDSATAQWGKWAFSIALVGLGLVFFMAITGSLPTRPNVSFVERLDYRWKFDNTDGAKLVYLLSANPGQPMPEILPMEVRLTADVAKDWEIEHIVGYSDASLDHELTAEGPSKIQKDSTSTKYMGMWYNLRGGAYYFVVSLHSPKKASRETLYSTLDKDKQAVAVTVGGQGE